MNPKIDFVPSPSWLDLLQVLDSKPAENSSLLENAYSHSFTGSGKAALAAVLSFLRETNVLKNKMTEIFVPQWLGIQVYQTMLEYCFPRKTTPDNCSAFLVYHQFGFPQKMDKILDFSREKKMVLIEDCAHSLGSLWEGKPLGTFGDFSIFSYSKYTFCYALGGINYKSPEFERFLNERKGKSNKVIKRFIDAFKFIDEMNLAKTDPMFENFMNQLRKMAYAAYPDSVFASALSVNLWNKKRTTEIEWRRQHFLSFLKDTEKFDFLQDLSLPGVVPYALPLLVPEESKREILLEKLNSLGIMAGLRQFDVNRSHLEPNYQPCLLLPFHSQMGSTKVNQVAELLNKVL